MKQAVLVAIYFSLSMTISAATLSETKILEASNNIKYLMQNIAKNYLYEYIYPMQLSKIDKKIERSITNLEKNINIIALNTSRTDIKALLEFIVYEKDEIKAMVKTKPDSINANEIIDVSETVTESAERIANVIKHDYSFEEKMFLRTKNIEYMVEKFAMYYVIMTSDIDKSTISEKLDQLVVETGKELEKVDMYSYPEIYKEPKKDIFRYWDTEKHYLSNVKSAKLPSIVLLSANGIQTALKKLAIHHAKGE